jgi:hypothetical protein
MQPFAALQIEWRAGVVWDADTECEICVGAYFPGHKVANGRHGVGLLLGSRHSTAGWGWSDRGVFHRTVGGGFMSNVLSLRCARERAWQPGGGSNGHAFKGLGQSVWKYKTTERDGRTASNQRLLGRLEAENAQLRERVVELALQIQALRDRARTLTA